MLAEFVFTICLAADPTRCKDISKQMEWNGLPFACHTYGQIEIAEFMKKYPEWTVSRFKCVPSTKREVDA